MAEVSVEREAKLTPPPGFRLPPLGELLPGVEAVELPEVTLQATYFDAPDLRVTRAGASLRHRRGWTVKLPAGLVEHYLLRTEHRFDGSPGTPPAAALDLLTAYLRTAQAAPVSRLRTRRRRVELRDAAGHALVEVTDDEVSVLDGRRIASRFREIEVEVLAAAPSPALAGDAALVPADTAATITAPGTVGPVERVDASATVDMTEPVGEVGGAGAIDTVYAADAADAAEPTDTPLPAGTAPHAPVAVTPPALALTPGEVGDVVVAALRAAGAGPVDPVPKIVRALGPVATEPPDVVTAAPGRDPSAADVVQHALAASVLRLFAHDAGVRLAEDPEAVHQARVATRRLRSALRTFRGFLDPEWTAQLRDELRWLGDELGPVRDNEVLLDRLHRHAARLPDAEHLAVERVVAHLVGVWEDARAELLAAIRSDRYRTLLDHLVEAARAPALLPEAAGPARALLPAVVRGPWQHLRRSVAELGGEPPDEALHAVRIRAKRCRYAAEAVEPVFGKRARSFARAVTAVQEVLGEHQDAVVARRWLAKEAADLPAGSAFAAGMLAGVELAAADAARAAFPAVWKAASRKRLRDWL